MLLWKLSLRGEPITKYLLSLTEQGTREKFKLACHLGWKKELRWSKNCWSIFQRVTVFRNKQNHCLENTQRQ